MTTYASFADVPEAERPKIARRIIRRRRWVAVHESGHAVASWAMQRELGRDWPQFDEIVLRTPEEIFAGPFIDRWGRANDVLGIVTSSDRYSPIYHGRFVFMDGDGNQRTGERLSELIAQLRRNMEADAIDTLAGPCAEARYRRTSLFAIYLGGGDGDWESARRKVRDFEPNKTKASAMLNHLEKRSRKLVRQPEIWRAIVALADELERRGRIEGDEAHALIAQTVGA